MEGAAGTSRSAERCTRSGTPDKRGACLILAFDYNSTRNEALAQPQGKEAVVPRPSAPKEAQMCAETFESLGFNTEIVSNLGSRDFKPTIEEKMKQMPDDVKAFILVLIGRAEHDKAEFEGGSVDFKNIWKHTLKCSKFDGKLKLVFIDMDEPKASYKASANAEKCGKGRHNAAPHDRDVLFFDSTRTGFPPCPSIPPKSTGISAFIYHLTQELNQHGRSRDLESLLCLVQEKVRATPSQLQPDVSIIGEFSSKNPEYRNMFTFESIVNSYE